jgi:hypothetical protein
MTPYDDSRDLSEIDRFLQRACGALGRLHAEQVVRGLSRSSSSQPSQSSQTTRSATDHYAAVAAALDAANGDGELRAAIDAALVAQYPALQRLRDAVARDGYADDDETAPYLSQMERARGRFARWLLGQGRISEWRVGNAPVSDDTQGVG